MDLPGSRILEETISVPAARDLFRVLSDAIERLPPSTSDA